MDDRKGESVHNDRETAPQLRSEAFLRDAMDRFGDAVYRTALSRTRSAIDAEDVFQDVFLRLLKRRDGVRERRPT